MKLSEVVQKYSVQWPLAIPQFVDLTHLHTLLWFTTNTVETNMIMKHDIYARKWNTLIKIAHTIVVFLTNKWLNFIVQFKTERTLLILLFYSSMALYCPKSNLLLIAFVNVLNVLFYKRRLITIVWFIWE